MMAFFQKLLAQLLAALMALFGITTGQEALPQFPVEQEVLESHSLSEYWGGEGLDTQAVDDSAENDGLTAQGVLTDDLAWGAVAQSFSSTRSLPGSSGNFGSQLSGPAYSIYETLLTVTTDGFDEASQVNASPNYVEYVAPFASGDYLVYRRAISGSNGERPNSNDQMAINAMLQTQIQSALEAFGRDCPEIFWIAYGAGNTTYDFGGTFVVDGTDLVITVTSLELYMRVKDTYAGQVTATAAQLAQEVADLQPTEQGLTRQEIVRHFHNEIISRVGLRMYYFYDRSDDATGPLLRGLDTAPYGSAMGFAKAFKLLCDAQGIPSVIVSGTRTYPSAMAHTWNAVQMEDGNWYAVDALMDNGYSVAGEATYYEYLLAGENTVDFSFGREPFYQSHVPSGYFTSNNYFDFAYPALSPVRYTAGLELEPLENALALELPYPAYCYTTTSLADFEAEKLAGEEVLNRPGLSQADQEEVDAAAANIVLAYATLVPLQILVARTGATTTVSFGYHQVTLSSAGITPAVLLAQEVQSGIDGAQITVTLAQPEYTYVGTGATVTVAWTSGSENCVEVYTVLLLGDTNGDGLVDGNDTQTYEGLYSFAEADGVAVITDVDESQARGTLTLPEYTSGGSLVVGVNSNAFLFCNEVTEIIVPNTYTTLGTRSFYFMTGLERLSLGAGITEIPEEMAYMCENLWSVSFQGDVVNIGRRAFADCNSLLNLVLPSSVQTIGSYAFSACTSLLGIVLPDGLQSIGTYAFQRCSALGDIVVPNSVTQIGFGAFVGCTNVTLVCGYQSAAHVFALEYGIRFRLLLVLQGIEITRMPNKLIYFTGDSFSAQGMEVRAYFDNGGELVLNAASYTVEGFSTALPGIVTVTLRYQTQTTSFQIRVYDFNYALIEGNSQAMVTRYVGLGADAVVPSEIEGLPVTMIGATTFAGRDDVATIAIAPTVAAIQTGAFDGATNLRSFEVGNGNTAFSVSDGLLYNAAGSRLIAYPAGRSDTAFTLPAPVTEIAPRAFSGCAALEYLYTGLTAQTWPADAVYNCPGLTMRVYEFSTAHFYADSDSINYELVSTAQAMLLTPPDKLHYIVREALDTTGMLVQLRYADNAVYTVPEGYALSPFNNATSGLRTITVTFQRFSQSFDVTVVESESRVYRYEVLSEEPKEIKLVRYLGTGGDLVVPDYIDNYKVTVLGAGLYDGQTTITSIIVQDTVTTVESRVFAGCSSMTHIYLPESLVSIGDEAFSRCTGLDALNLPDSLQTIGSYAFADCTGLTEVELPDGLLSLGSYAFSGCTALVEADIGSALANMGNHVFAGCTALQNINVSQDNAAYSDVDGILFNKSGDTLLRYPIGRAGTTYIVPPQISAIGNGAFSGVQLQSVTMYRTVTSIAATAMSGANGDLVLYGYRDSPAHIFAQQYGVLFYPLPNPQPDRIELASLPTQLNYYVGDTFNTSGLQVRAVYPDNTSEILRSGYTVTGFDSSPLPQGTPQRNCTVTVAYMGCEANFEVMVANVSYTDFTFSRSPQGELTIISYTGSGGEVHIPALAIASGFSTPEPVVAIGNNAFQNKQAITRVVIPSSIASVGDYAFSGCTGLTEVVLPDNLTTLPDYVFQGCTALESINLSASLQSIGREAFLGSQIKYLPLPDSLQTISAMAFYGMPKLKHLSIPDSVTSIGAYAFDDCASLLTVFFGGATPAIDATAFGVSGRTYGLAPAGSFVSTFLNGIGQPNVAYTVSGDWAYGSWLGLSGQRIAAYLGSDDYVEVPASLGGSDIVGVLPHAFFNNQTIQSADLPEACSTTLGAGAFALCANLETVTVRYNAQLNSFFGNNDAEIFYGCSEVTLVGIAGSRVETYANDNGLGFIPLVVEYFVYVDNYNPFEPLGEDTQGRQMIAGFTEAYQTPAQVRELFALREGETLWFIKADESALLGENDVIGSGTLIQLWDDMNNVLATLVAVRFGDVTGDGRVDAMDAMMTQLYLLGLLTQSSFTEAGYLAMDANRDDTRNWTDFAWMSDSGVGVRDITQEW